MACSRFLVVTVTATVVLLHCSSIISAQDFCGVIGDDTQFQVDMTEMFYLDLEHPACCNGSITSWRVCYHEPESNSGEEESSYRPRYHVKYAVYRLGADQVYIVKPRSPTFSTTLSSDSESESSSKRRRKHSQYPPIINQGLNCHDEFLDEPFTIEEGDVIGACVVDPKDPAMRQLNIVSRVNGQPHALLPLYGTQEYAQPCKMGTIPPRIMISQLTAVNSTRLHLSANIRSSE